MLTTPGIRAVWQQAMSQSLPVATRRFMSAFFEAAGDPDPVAAEQSFVTRQALLRSWSEFAEHHPLIVAPIATDIPSHAGTDLDEGRVAEDLRTMRMAMAVNALGLPAVALPVGVADGLPQAVQVIGPRYREDLCLDAAAAIEDRVGIFTPIDPIAVIRRVGRSTHVTRRGTDVTRRPIDDWPGDRGSGTRPLAVAGWPSR